jgi:LacI family transcriptional regulator
MVFHWRMSAPLRRVTQAHIAAKAGVSIGTVSAVLNGRTSGIFYSDGTRDRVLEAARRLGYRVHAVARQLRMGCSKVIGLAVDDLSLPFLAMVVQNVVSGLREAGYDCLLLDLGGCRGKDAALKHLRHMFQEGKVDAFLLAGATETLSDGDIGALMDDRVPVVLVERHVKGRPVPSVVVDNRVGGRLAAEHLLQGGRRRMALIAGPKGNAMSDDRVAGACEAARAAGAPVPPARIVRGDWGLESGRRAMEQLLGGKPEAVFAANDMMAMGAMAAIHSAGLRIPEDVAVVGYDDVPPASFCRPTLSSIRQDPEVIGRCAVELVLFRLGCRAKQSATPPLQPALVVRESSRSV